VVSYQCRRDFTTAEVEALHVAGFGGPFCTVV